MSRLETTPSVPNNQQRHDRLTTNGGTGIQQDSPQKRSPARTGYQRDQGRDFRTQLSVFLAETFSWLFWLMPLPLRTFVAHRGGDAFLRYSRTYSGNVESNIRHVLDGASDSEIASIQRSIFRTSAMNFMDLLTMPRRTRESFSRSIMVRKGSWEIIERAIAEGTGVVMITGHVGCFDFIGQTFWARGYDMKVLTGRTTSRFIFDGVTHLRGAKGQVMVETTPSGVRDVLRTLRKGGSVVVMTDRDFFLSGRDVAFFGETTTLPPGAVRMARDTGAQVLTIFTRRMANGQHELEILEPFTVPRTSNLDEDLATGMQHIVERLEYGILNSIDQWVMFQRVWPDEAPNPVRVFPVGSPLESELLERVASALPERSAPGERIPLLERLREGGAPNPIDAPDSDDG